jgi:nitrogen fixation-related uncharacterized protein
MGIAGACIWAWAVHTGQLRDLESTKHQLFWADLAPKDPHETATEERPPLREGASQGSTR